MLTLTIKDGAMLLAVCKNIWEVVLYLIKGEVD